MRKLVCFILICSLVVLFSCKKDQVNLQEELQEGAWQCIKIEDKLGNLILDGKGEPALIFFFLANDTVKGRMKGTYSISKNDYLFFQVKIDSLAVNSWSPLGWVYDELDNFPPRYYEYEAIVKNGIDGQVQFYENGFDSRFSLQYASDRIMWFERY